MNLITDDISTWTTSLDGFKPEYFPIEARNILQFYRLDGRKTVICKDNIVPIENIAYTIYSPHEKKYHLRQYHNWTLNQAYFYRRDLDFSGEEEAIESLKRYILDENVWLLMTKEQVSETTAMLIRLWKYIFKDEGKLPYRAWIALLEQSLDLEDYREYGKSLIGYKTVCNQFERRIRDIWDQAYKTEKK